MHHLPQTLAGYAAIALLAMAVAASEASDASDNPGTKVTKALSAKKGNNENQREEIDRFKAYFLPVSEKAHIQEALDAHGSVRLGMGNYTGVSITMRSNQKLYGHPTMPGVTGVTIAAGSSNVVLADLTVLGGDLHFEAGAPITNCLIKSIKNSQLIAKGAKIEGCTIMNIFSGGIVFDFSNSGYYRNNKIIKVQSGCFVDGTSGFLFKGNSTTPSFGNVHMWTNVLMPRGDGMVLDNLQSATFVGLDGEMWNSENKSVGKKSLFYATNMGDVKITDIAGADYSKTPSGGWNIQAKDVFFLHTGIGSKVPSLISPNANVRNFGIANDYNRSPGPKTGFDLRVHGEFGVHQQDVLHNNVAQNAPIMDKKASTDIASAILGTRKTPWARPAWEPLPDPLGADWRKARVGKPDSKDAIQKLIDTNKIAELPEGIFYIGSTLTVHSNGEGIVGSGTGKTVIVGLTDDFPLITMANSKEFGVNYQLAYLTLQGGSVGQFFPENYGGIAFVDVEYVVFRDQPIGIHLYKMGGMDNNFFDNVSFVNCGTGFFQNPKPITDNVNMSGYIDKTVFYDGQYVNCGIGLSNHAMRGNNLNAWINCKFDGNKLAMDTGSNSTCFAANCDFTKTHGEYIVKGGDFSYYSCNFHDNPVTVASMKMVLAWIEGCNFMDNVRFNERYKYSPASCIVVNSTIAGDVLKDENDGREKDVSAYINTKLLAHPELSRMLVHIKDKKPVVIIDANPNPYPQLLVTGPGTSE